MMFLLFFLIFVGVCAACWFQGAWSCVLNIINLLFAALIATNFWEPISQLLEENVDKVYTYVYDFLVLWVLFAASYALLRAITNGVSEHRVEFHPYLELGARSVLCLICGWIFLSFALFTLHTSPLPPSPMGAWATPQDGVFMFDPDVRWMEFAFARSRGSLAREKYSESDAHPNDASSNVETFDSLGDFRLRYHDRREKFAKATGF